MSDSFEVARTEGDLDDETRHAIVAAQLRGERKAAGRGPDAVIEAVAEELRGLGVEPNHDELDADGSDGDADGDGDGDGGAGEASLPADAPRGDGLRAEEERQRRVAGGDHHDPV